MGIIIDKYNYKWKIIGKIQKIKELMRKQEVLIQINGEEKEKII